MLLPPADDDDDLPPLGLPFADLLAWIAARLGRRPTLEEVAAVRWMQQQQRARRDRRAERERRRIDWELAARRRDDGETPIRSVLNGPEMAVFWAALPWLVGTLPGLVAAARVYDEWATRPETVLRLAERAEQEAVRMPSAVFDPPPRLEAEGVIAYARWKLSAEPERLAPLESVGLDRLLVAGINAGTPAAAERAIVGLEGATSDTERRRVLAGLRAAGTSARSAWPGAEKFAGGPPVGLIPDPEPEPVEPVEPGGEDGPPAGPRPPGGGKK